MLKLSDLASRPDFYAGPLLVSPSRRRVEGPVGHVLIEPLVMQVFLLLIDGRGRVITRDELFDKCWGGVIVGDDSLNRAIAKVRRIAAGAAPGLFGIETIPRTGYRLTGDLLSFMEEAPQGADAQDQPTGGATTRRAVIAGSAAAVAAAGAASWAIFSPREDPRFEALVGRADQILRFEVPSTQVQAAGLLRQAVAIEPSDARAWGLFAFALASVADDGAPAAAADAMPAAENAVRTALELEPREPNALLARFMLQHSLRNWTETDERLRLILRLDPSNLFAMSKLVELLQSSGLDEESWVWNERAIAIDPVAPVHLFRRALKHWIHGRAHEADVTADRLMQLWPRHPWVWNARFLIYGFTDRADAALDMLGDEQRRPKTVSPLAVSTWRLSLAALKERSQATIAAARDATLVAARTAPGLAAYGTMVLSELGELDAAFAIVDGLLLSRGNVITRQPTDSRGFVNTAAWRMTQWMFTPPTAAIRADPRFGALCDGIGLSDYWSKRGVVPDYLQRR